METFLHVGYPKCFSTTLQKEFFSKHPDIYYGGIGTGSTNIDFINDDMNLLFESGIIYFRNELFKENFPGFKKNISLFLEEAKKSNRKISGFSSEHLLFNFSSQMVDIDIKLERIQQLFGKEIKIIVIIREQFSLIVSLYKEYVNMGYQYPFSHFFFWIYKYQDRNFYNELMYSRVFKNIISKFGKNNIQLLFFEDYKKSMADQLNDNIFNDISDFLKISRLTFNNISNKNPSLDAFDIQKRVEVNNSIKYDFGSSVLDGIEDHRRRMFFNKYLKLNLSERELYHNVLNKREARDYNNNIESVKEERFEIDEIVFERMKEEFEKDNKKLSDIFNKDVNEIFNESRMRTFEKFTFANNN